MDSEYSRLERNFNSLHIIDRYKNILKSEGFYKEYFMNNTHCILKRNSLGCWCGYVALSKNHQDYNVIVDDLYHYSVHGGINYFGDVATDNINMKGYKWLGFDCGHYNDVSPTNILKDFDDGYAVYRDLEYVENELDSLSLQVYNRSLSKKIKDVFKKL